MLTAKTKVFLTAYKARLDLHPLFLLWPHLPASPHLSYSNHTGLLEQAKNSLDSPLYLLFFLLGMFSFLCSCFILLLPSNLAQKLPSSWAYSWLPFQKLHVARHHYALFLHHFLHCIYHHWTYHLFASFILLVCSLLQHTHLNVSCKTVELISVLFCPLLYPRVKNRTCMLLRW